MSWSVRDHLSAEAEGSPTLSPGGASDSESDVLERLAMLERGVARCGQQIGAQ